MIPSGHKIGILGGGQLGTFFTIAAKRLGYHVTVWDPHPEAPAHAWADTRIDTGFDDTQGRRNFIKACEAASYEWENIPVELVEAIEAEIPVRPDGRVLALLQNRIKEKSFLSEHNFPIVPYHPIQQIRQLQSAAETLGFPLICKTATAGYDGHGQWILNQPEEIESFTPLLKACPEGWIVEKYVPLHKELAIVAVRDNKGDVYCYPVTENRHEEGILRQSKVPAEIEASLLNKVSSLSVDILTTLEGTGVFCIEFFLLNDGTLLINEIAPRPHNSGHYTLDVCPSSQFEMQVRVVCDLPLVPPRLLSQAAMINIMGAEIRALEVETHLNALLEIEGTKIYHYRKNEIINRRKMGHITLTNSDSERLSGVRAILDRAAGKRDVKRPL